MPLANSRHTPGDLRRTLPSAVGIILGSTTTGLCAERAPRASVGTMATARTGLRAATGLLAVAGRRGFATAATSKPRVLITGKTTSALCPSYIYPAHTDSTCAPAGRAAGALGQLGTGLTRLLRYERTTWLRLQSHPPWTSLTQTASIVFDYSVAQVALWQ